MNENERAAAALRHQERPHDGLAHARWCDEHTDVIGEKCFCRSALRTG
jgi:hypothetical protein